MPLEGVKISIGRHTRSGSTMINTPWCAKIDGQELFYFKILPVGGTLIDPAVSLKTRLELYTDAHGTLIFDNYDECSPKNHERTEPIMRRWSTIGYNMKLQILLLRREVIMKNKTKWELSALVSCRSLDERTAVESQINGLYLTSWCRHHNSVLVSKSCARRTQYHQDPLWRYGFCLPTPVLYKISTKANIQMVNRGEGSCTSNLHARSPVPSAFSC